MNSVRILDQVQPVSGPIIGKELRSITGSWTLTHTSGVCEVWLMKRVGPKLPSHTESFRSGARAWYLGAEQRDSASLMQEWLLESATSIQPSPLDELDYHIKMAAHVWDPFRNLRRCNTIIAPGSHCSSPGLCQVNFPLILFFYCLVKYSIIATISAEISHITTLWPF